MTMDEEIKRLKKCIWWVDTLALSAQASGLPIGGYAFDMFEKIHQECKKVELLCKEGKL